jgi:predicted ester cyclase
VSCETTYRTDGWPELKACVANVCESNRQSKCCNRFVVSDHRSGPSPAGASHDNKRTARRALEEIYTQGNLELLDEVIHSEFVDHEPAHPELATGPDSVRETVQQLRGAFSDLRFEVEDEIAEADRVVQRVVMRGRHTGPLAGGNPTGRSFAVRHIYIWRIASDGRITEHWGSRDDLGLLRQLGLLAMAGDDEPALSTSPDDDDCTRQDVQHGQIPDGR